MKLRTLAGCFSDRLSNIYGEEEAHAIFLMAIEGALQYSRADYLLKKDQVLNDVQQIKLQNILTELQNGKPIQYVLGEAFFYGLRLKVGPSVLIPRPETEELVAWILETIALTAAAGQSMRLLDIGTGSGCIAISLKKNMPGSEVFALDISEAAIEIATVNSLLNEVTIDFITGDIRNFSTPQKFDLMVSNPPYVTLKEKEDMQENVLAHEPHLALFVADERPLEFYEAIADFAWANLSDMGLLFFEINEHLGKEMVEMLTARSFTNIELKKDMQGKDRMLCCKLKRPE